MVGSTMNTRDRRRVKQIITDIEAIEAGGSHGQLPIVWDKARGAAVWDLFGNYFIDFTSTIFVTNCGHGAVTVALREQSKRLIHSYTFATVAKLSFLRTFKKFLPGQCERIFLASAGSEVTSWAVNLMRDYKKGGIIVHIDGAFHGKTGSVAKLQNSELTLPFLDESVVWEDIVKELYQNEPNISGIMIESYQGWSGKFMDPKLVQQLCAWAQTRDIPVCFDEIQGGFYRTGYKFAYQWYGVEPDLICMGKGLGGGLPISALAGREKYFNVKGLSSTHSGNPLCCAGAEAALKVYNNLNTPKNQPDFIKRIKYFELQLNTIQEQHPDLIRKVNCHGFLAGLICPTREIADAICNKCIEHRLLVVRTGRESIKLGPPLVITEKELIKGMAKLAVAVSEVANDSKY